MKKIILILSIFVFAQAFAIRAVTEKEHEDYLKHSLLLNENQIETLNAIDKEHFKQLDEALEKSRAYRRNNPQLSKEECDKYTSKLLAEVNKNYKKDLSKVLNFWQKNQYLEYRSRVY